MDLQAPQAQHLQLWAFCEGHCQLLHRCGTHWHTEACMGRVCNCAADTRRGGRQSVRTKGKAVEWCVACVRCKHSRRVHGSSADARLSPSSGDSVSSVQRRDGRVSHAHCGPWQHQRHLASQEHAGHCTEAGSAASVSVAHGDGGGAGTLVLCCDEHKERTEGEGIRWCKTATCAPSSAIPDTVG